MSRKTGKSILKSVVPVVMSLMVSNFLLQQASTINPNLLEIVLGTGRAERFAEAEGYWYPQPVDDDYSVEAGSAPFVINPMYNDVWADYSGGTSGPLTNTTGFVMNSNTQISNITGDTGAVITVLNTPPVSGATGIINTGSVSVDTTNSFTGVLTFNYETCDSLVDPINCGYGTVLINVGVTTISNISVSTPEETTYQFLETDFTNSFSNTQSGLLGAIVIRSLPTHGTLLMYDAPAVADDSSPIGRTWINPPVSYGVGGFKYQPDPNFCGTDTFLYNADAVIQASGGTPQSVVSLDNKTNLRNLEYQLNNKTVTITVGCVNDTPTSTSFAVTTPFNTQRSFVNGTTTYFNQNFADIDSVTQGVGEYWVVEYLEIMTLPTKGVLGLDYGGGDYTNLSVGNKVEKIDLNKIKYQPNNGVTGVDSFTWRASDEPSTQNVVVVSQNKNLNPQEFSNTSTTNITIQDFVSNTPPVVDDFVLESGLNQSINFTTSLFQGNYSDVDGDVLSQVKITNLPVNGTLYLGSNLYTGSFIAVADLGDLRYVPNVGFSGEEVLNYISVNANGTSNQGSIVLRIGSIGNLPNGLLIRTGGVVKSILLPKIMIIQGMVLAMIAFGVKTLNRKKD
jgi:hypothetical protein